MQIYDMYCRQDWIATMDRLDCLFEVNTHAKPGITGAADAAYQVRGSGHNYNSPSGEFLFLMHVQNYFFSIDTFLSYL